MEEDGHFKNFTVSQFRQYSLDRDVIASDTLKEGLIACCLAAPLLKSPTQGYASRIWNRIGEPEAV